jgi:hypothetical protein
MSAANMAMTNENNLIGSSPVVPQRRSYPITHQAGATTDLHTVKERQNRVDQSGSTAACIGWARPISPLTQIKASPLVWGFHGI